MGYLGAQAAAAEKKKAGATPWQPSSIDAAADAARGGVLFGGSESFGLPGCSGRLAIFRRCRSRLVALGPASPKSLTGSRQKEALGAEELGGEKAAPALRLSKTLRNGSRFSWAFQPSIAGPEQAAADLGDVQSLQQRASAAFL